MLCVVPALFLTALFALFALMLIASPEHAASGVEIDREVDKALTDLRKIEGANAFLGIAKGVLVFP